MDAMATTHIISDKLSFISTHVDSANNVGDNTETLCDVSTEDYDSQSSHDDTSNLGNEGTYLRGRVIYRVNVVNYPRDNTFH